MKILFSKTYFFSMILNSPEIVLRYSHVTLKIAIRRYTYVDHFWLVWGVCMCVRTVYIHRLFLFISGSLCVCLYSTQHVRGPFCLVRVPCVCTKILVLGADKTLWPGTYYCFLRTLN